jgi:hypothetical protein
MLVRHRWPQDFRSSLFSWLSRENAASDYRRDCPCCGRRPAVVRAHSFQGQEWRTARTSLAAVHAIEHESLGSELLKMVVALHYGTVIYDNIGAADRLGAVRVAQRAVAAANSRRESPAGRRDTRYRKNDFADEPLSAPVTPSFQRVAKGTTELSALPPKAMHQMLPRMTP